MKIAHICISNPFIDGWGYQENLLAKYLQKVGTHNYIIASANDFPTYLKQKDIEEIMAKGNRYLLNGLVVRRIQTKKISTSLVIPLGLTQILEEIKPDVIFHHNFNCSSLPISARYAKKKHIPLFCDNHADSINMSKNKLWVWFYYKFLIRMSTQLYKHQIVKAYGVTHSRCDFIHDYYGLSRDKIDFLPIGSDVDLAEEISHKSELRQKYGYNESDFVVVSGGKMGKEKRTDNLIEAVNELHTHYPQLRLILFGKFEDDDTKLLANHSGATTVHGWCDRTKTLELLKMANVACWPFHHTTLIEDAVAVCTPIINRKTGTSEHLINGNGVWVKDGTKDELKEALLQLLNPSKEQQNQIVHSCEKTKQTISYHTIAKKLLEDISVSFRGLDKT